MYPFNEINQFNKSETYYCNDFTKSAHRTLDKQTEMGFNPKEPSNESISSS